MSCSSSVEAQASGCDNQPKQTENIAYMHIAFYNAAEEGRIEIFKNVQEPLNHLLTPNKNTILHIYITALNNTEPLLKIKHVLDFFGISLPKKTKPQPTTIFLERIVEICPPLLWQCNAKGETPLHIAARYGHAAVVQVLIGHAKALFVDLESQVEAVEEMLRMTNQEKNTALHEAVRYNHLEVVRLLLREDPKFVYCANDVGETLLYMAIERGLRDVAFEILATCNSAAYTGPLGRTALHAAVFWNDEGIVKRMLQKIGTIARQPDQKGWTPLHLAAYFNRWRAVTPLLEHDRQVAYIKDTEGRTALHIAAYEGNHRIVDMIISHYPDCCKLVDKKGWNVLHFSLEGKSSTLPWKIFLDHPSLTNLLNEKDKDGNTVFLHHFQSPNGNLRIFLYHPRVDRLAFNNKNLNLLDLALVNERLSGYQFVQLDLLKWRIFGLRPSRRLLTEEDYITKPEKEDQKDKHKGIDSIFSRWEKVYEVHLVVATLVTTVTFTAGFTMPGGFIGKDRRDSGSAVLATSAAFKAFVVTDTVAMLLSSWAVFAHMLLPFLFFPTFNNRPARVFLANSATYCIMLALGAMVLAFVTGTYAVLAHHYRDIGISTWTIGTFLFVSICVYVITLVFRVSRMGSQ